MHTTIETGPKAPALEVRAAASAAAPSVAALAALAMTAPELVIASLSQSGNVDAALTELVANWPGAVEALMRADSAPRWFKTACLDAFEEGGYQILT